VSSDVQLPNGSPFDAIRRVDERGEHWTARDLMPVMTYDRWENFEEVISRAISAAGESGADPDQHFSRQHEKGAAGRPRINYRLTRYAAYLVAMNGDPRKRAVAEGQSYFAVRTHQAETMAAAPVTLPDFSSLDPAALAYLGQIGQALTATSQALMVEQAKNAEQTKELEAARPKAAFVDTYVNPSDTTLFRTFAEQINQPEQALRKYLMARKVIYRTVIGYRGKKRTPEYEYHAYADYKTWFHSKDQPEAPRLSGGRMRTTLYVTALGKVRIQAMLQRRPLHLVIAEEAS